MLDIVFFQTLDCSQRNGAADILLRALAHVPSAYSSIAEARAEVTAFEDSERIAFAALEEGNVVGWIGSLAVYDHAWELHPLVVDPARQGEGIGTALCDRLERHAAALGILTLYLGSDDDFGGTNLFGADLSVDPLVKLQSIAPVKGHPFTFYKRLGWSVVGVIPDANGRGKPDIMLAKRIA